jgi:hypothetical protein
MVVAGCAAIVFAPVGVMAATGQIVNIADGSNASRLTRVGSNGTLFTETRAGVLSNAFNMNLNNVVDLSLHKMIETGYPNHLAITEVTVGTRGTENGYTTQVDVRAYVRTSGTNACGGAGWTSTMLRRLSVKTNETVQLVFDGPPLVLPVPASGQRVCLTMSITQLPSGIVADFGGTGYQFT